MKTRTFIAIAATDEVYDAAVKTIRRLSRLVDCVTWVEAQNLHWTLHFLGELDDNEIYSVCRATEQTTAEVDAFGAVAGGVSTFGPLEHPRTLWIGLDEGADAFAKLYTNLQQRLDALGIRGDRRKYVPHLTLGRVAKHAPAKELATLANELSKLAETVAGPFHVNEVTVYASRLRRESPDYKVYGSFSLD